MFIDHLYRISSLQGIYIFDQMTRYTDSQDEYPIFTIRRKQGETKVKHLYKEKSKEEFALHVTGCTPANPINDAQLTP